MTCTIDENEGNVTNIPGTLLHAELDQDVHMILEDTIAEIILKSSSPDYMEK